MYGSYSRPLNLLIFQVLPYSDPICGEGGALTAVNFTDGIMGGGHCCQTVVWRRYGRLMAPRLTFRPPLYCWSLSSIVPTVTMQASNTPVRSVLMQMIWASDELLATVVFLHRTHAANRDHSLRRKESRVPCSFCYRADMQPPSIIVFYL